MKSKAESFANEKLLGATVHRNIVSPSQTDVVGITLTVVVGDQPLMRAIAEIVLEDRVCLGRPMHRLASLDRILDFLKRHTPENDRIL